MKARILSPTLRTLALTLALSRAGHAQTLDKAKLDQLFDQLLEKNKAMGSVTIAKDGNVLYKRSFGYSQVNGTGREQSVVALEATAESTFEIDPAPVFEFDAAKGQMTIKRPGGDVVLTKGRQ